MFQHLFDKHSQRYAQFRPKYPRELYEFILAHVDRRHLAWDCGTGSGQAALALAPSFDQVIATDSSAAQLEHAQPAPNVEYRHAPSENSTLKDNSVDLITAANAVHWFDLNAFYPEAHRVLHDGGVIAVWCYSGVHTDFEPLEEAKKELADELEKYWPKPIEWVQARYRTLPFPFEEIAAPKFSLSVEWQLDQFLGYISTWSAREEYRKANGIDPIEAWANKHADLFSDTTTKHEFRFPLHLKIGKYCRK